MFVTLTYNHIETDFNIDHIRRYHRAVSNDGVPGTRIVFTDGADLFFFYEMEVVREKIAAAGACFP